jgi:S1-C subfamily serine protease
LTVDGAPASRSRKLAAALDSESIGREIELRLIRGGTITTLRATVEARPQHE